MTGPTDSDPILIDSSGWLENLTDGPKADLFSPYFGQVQNLLVPSIVIYEVHKILVIRQSSTLADRFLSAALRCKVTALDELIALSASVLSIDHHLAMADAIIFATARHYKSKLITSDTHFVNLPGVTLL